jgi:hypothetical protein
MENKMTNQERLEEYLVGNKEKNVLGYLKDTLSNGKVIMLSGKWGSGKTHFWQNKIQTILNNKDEKIPNHYISLYGKTSIDEIRNEVFLKIFESVDSSKLEEKGTKLAKNTVDLIVSFIKSIDIDGVKIDLSTISDNSFRQLEKFLKNKKIKKTVEYLNKSAIICFDDFERKSKDIDLNDLFGFITQLTLNFDCKVVIILNDDVFEGEEKNVFSRVKEKSVSKFLKYEPSIRDLFKSIIFQKNSEGKFKYSELKKYLKIILKTIEETQELNARIYIQVFDNLVEWLRKTNITNENFIKYLILVNINFILNHYVFNLKLLDKNNKENQIRFFILDFELENRALINYIDKSKEYQNINYVEGLKLMITNENMLGSKTVDKTSLLKYIDENQALVRSLYYIYGFNINKLAESNNQAEYDIFNKINNFIESGILINE